MLLVCFSLGNLGVCTPMTTRTPGYFASSLARSGRVWMQLMQQKVQKSRRTTLPFRSLSLIGPAVFYVDAHDIVYIPEHNGGLLSVLTLEGERLAQWGDPSFRSCHGIWGDSRGDLYVVRPGAWGRPRRVVKYTRQR